jgi:hypothetical protein
MGATWRDATEHRHAGATAKFKAARRFIGGFGTLHRILQGSSMSQKAASDFLGCQLGA